VDDDIGYFTSSVADPDPDHFCRIRQFIDILNLLFYISVNITKHVTSAAAGTVVKYKRQVKYMRTDVE
jgi:hypothetical protein